MPLHAHIIPPAGASDAASCICIILELARTIVANPAVKLHAPVVFLMNGGEETLSQASNGFFATSRWVSAEGLGLAEGALVCAGW
jgi:hypothetical protein